MIEKVKVVHGGLREEREKKKKEEALLETLYPPQETPISSSSPWNCQSQRSAFSFFLLPPLRLFDSILFSVDIVAS